MPLCLLCLRRRYFSAPFGTPLCSFRFCWSLSRCASSPLFPALVRFAASAVPFLPFCACRCAGWHFGCGVLTSLFVLVLFSFTAHSPCLFLSLALLSLLRSSALAFRSCTFTRPSRAPPPSLLFLPLFFSPPSFGLCHFVMVRLVLSPHRRLSCLLLASLYSHLPPASHAFVLPRFFITPLLLVSLLLPFSFLPLFYFLFFLWCVLVFRDSFRASPPASRGFSPFVFWFGASFPVRPVVSLQLLRASSVRVLPFWTWLALYCSRPCAFAGLVSLVPLVCASCFLAFCAFLRNSASVLFLGFLLAACSVLCLSAFPVFPAFDFLFVLPVLSCCLLLSGAL